MLYKGFLISGDKGGDVLFKEENFKVPLIKSMQTLVVNSMLNLHNSNHSHISDDLSLRSLFADRK